MMRSCSRVLTASALALGGFGLAALAGCDGSAIDTAAAPSPQARDWRASVDLPAVSVDLPDPSDPGTPAMTVAAITAAEGEEVIPQTVLHLRAVAPGEAADPVVAWAWEVAQPEGSVSLFVPSATVASPLLEVDVAGLYALTVHMRTASGASHEAHLMVAVVPDSALHVELLWHTPGDGDESNTGMDSNGNSLGSDVDLHLARTSPAAIDGGVPPAWFSENDDAYWLNPNPAWDDTWHGPNNPHLDRDDTDGAGPENMNLDVIDPTDCYAIGVHYWDDWGYGASTATVRVYIMGELAYETDALLVNHDLWLVGWLCSEEAVVTASSRCDGTGCHPNITPNFPVPLSTGFPFVRLPAD